MRSTLETMPDGCGVKIVIQDDQVGLMPVGRGELISVLSNPTRRAVVSLLSRPGAAFFHRYLELKYYPPLSDREPLLEYYYYKLGDFLNTIISVPAEEVSILHEAAKATRMVLKEGYQMFCIGPEGVEELLPFPDFAMVMENAHDHLLYTDRAAAERQEREDLLTLERAYFSDSK